MSYWICGVCQYLIRLECQDIDRDKDMEPIIYDNKSYIEFYCQLHPSIEPKKVIYCDRKILNENFRI